MLRAVPPPLPNRWAKMKDFLQLVAVAGGIIAATFGTAVAWVDSMATDQEVTTLIAGHNLADTSHPRAALRAEALERSVAELEASRAATVELWKVLVGYGCSDREEDRRLKASAAAYCREVFAEKVSKGEPAIDAYRSTLREPWMTRPRNH